MNTIIETDRLTKRYGEKIAVNQMSVHVEEGDIYGLIGKNGAGKTSLMRLLLGLTTPTSGTMELFGTGDLNSARRKIGSLIEAPGLYKNESAFENMKRFSLLVKTSDEEIRTLLERVGLRNVGNKKAGMFSLGMRQRLGIAIAMLGHPELLILDEPINGLDPAGIKEVRDIIIELHRSGVTFIISSHLLDELGKIATSYGIVNNGALVEEITAEALTAKCRQALDIITDNPESAKKVLSINYPGMELACNDQTVSVYSEIKDTSEINRLLVSSGVRVYELKQESTGFEDFFIERLGK